MHVCLDDLMVNPLAMLTTSTGEVVVQADPGAHTLLCRLHGSDHEIIEPQLIDEVDLMVRWRAGPEPPTTREPAERFLRCSATAGACRGPGFGL